MASIGLAAVGHRKVLGPITAGQIFWKSAAIGRQVQRAETMLRQLAKRNRDREGHQGISRTDDLLKVMD